MLETSPKYFSNLIVFKVWPKSADGFANKNIHRTKSRHSFRLLSLLTSFLLFSDTVYKICLHISMSNKKQTSTIGWKMYFTSLPYNKWFGECGEGGLSRPNPLCKKYIKHSFWIGGWGVGMVLIFLRFFSENEYSKSRILIGLSFVL